MGDRGNIAVKVHGGTVYLYTHWCGHRLPLTLKAALSSDAGKQRAADCAYLTRIIFEALISNASCKETGYGISCMEAGDNEHPLLIVDPETQQVMVRPTPCGTDCTLDSPPPSETYSFAEFLALPDSHWEEF